MAYKQSPLAYSRTSNMPGLEYSEEDLAQKERIASNALGITPPADLLDGEFFLKDNDPQDFYRTLYIKRGESLDKIVTFTNTGKAIFDGVNEINLSDDEEVKGVLPKKKIITAAATAKYSAVSTFILYDGNKFQEVEKDDVSNDIANIVNENIKDDYFNKTKDKINLTNQVVNILGKNNGGLGVALTNSDARGIFWVNLNSTETDINSIIKSGFYQCYNWTNYPTGASNSKQGALWNFSWNDNKDGNSSGFGYQLYITAVGEIWGRFRNNSNFSSWKRLQTLTGINTIAAGGTEANTAQGAANNILKSVSTASMLSSSSYAFILESNVVKKILASKLGGNVEVLETTYATWEVGLATITGTLKGELTSIYQSPNMGNPNGTQECNPSNIKFPMEVTNAYKVSGNLPNNRFTIQVLANGTILFSYTGTTNGEKCSLAGIVVKAQRV